jgi:TolB-like protein/Tfp pilus assembly protein PilF
VPALGLPDSVMTLLLKIFIAGFPVSLILAWLFNVTNKGIVRANDETDHQKVPQANIQTTIAVAGSLVLVLLTTIGSQLRFEEPEQTQSLAIVAQTPAETARTLAARPLADEGKASIAILPFVPCSNDAEDEFFADGMVEELLNSLAKLPNLQVAARTSSFAYKGVTNKTVTQIGEELGVNHILEGSIRKNDVTNKIRVTAQLIKAVSGEQIWSETYDREYQDIFQIQDDIAKAVVDKMKVTLLGGSIDTPFIAPTSSVDAMVAYGKGQKELSHRTVISLNNALAHFEQAIDLDSNYARAYVGIADAQTLLALYGNVVEKDAHFLAQQAIDKALEIDDNLAEAHATQGLILRETEEEKAENSFKKAMALNPNYAPTYMWYAGMLTKRGEVEQAHSLYEQAFKLDPKSPVAAYLLAQSYYESGNEGKTMELFSHIVANDPDYPGAYLLVGGILQKRGRLDESISMYKRALDVDALNKKAVKGLITASSDLGIYDRSEQWLEYARAHDEMFDDAMMNYLKFHYHISQGQQHQAFDYLNQVSFESESDHGSLMNDVVDGNKAYYQGNYQAAIDAYERARSREGVTEASFYRMGDGRVPAHLAHAYAQLEMTDKYNDVMVGLEGYLDSVKSKKRNDPSYYYAMALVRTLQNKTNEAFYYLQGAIDVGWVRAWEAEVEPILKPINEDIQFTLMLGGVKARLATMRVRMADEEEFLLAGSEEI